MELEGKVWKDDKDPGWLIEVPYLHIMTQGKTRKDALLMIEDAVKLMMEDTFEGKEFDIIITSYEKNIFGITCSEPNLLLSFALKRQREMNNITIREAAKRMGSTYPNTYARYERGNVHPTIMKYDQLLHAVNPKSHGLFIR